MSLESVTKNSQWQWRIGFRCCPAATDVRVPVTQQATASADNVAPDDDGATQPSSSQLTGNVPDSDGEYSVSQLEKCAVHA